MQKRAETKKPTCVGFFVECDLLTSVQQQPVLERLEQQRLEQQLEPKRRQRVLGQQLERQQVQLLLFYRKRQETRPSGQQPGRSVSSLLFP